MTRVGACTVRLCGTGGQGLVLGARILCDALLREGRFVAHTQSYEPYSRGGVSRSDIVVDDGPVEFPLAESIDVLVVLDQSAVRGCDGMLLPGATVLSDEDLVAEPPPGGPASRAVPLAATATRVGDARAANMVALGALAGATGLCGLESLEAAVRAGMPQRLVERNLEALREGHRLTT